MILKVCSIFSYLLIYLLQIVLNKISFDVEHFYVLKELTSQIQIHQKRFHGMSLFLSIFRVLQCKSIFEFLYFYDSFILFSLPQMFSCTFCC